jgi:IMP dehydrogenase
LADIEIGIGKSGRRAYSLDEITIVPSRRTRDTANVDISWQLEAFHLELPLMTAAMDSVVSPTTAVEVGRLGGLGVLNLEGLWARYEDPEPVLAKLSEADDDDVARLLQDVYAAPVQPALVTARLEELGRSGVVVCGSVSPQRATELAPVAVAAGVDVLVIKGTVVSAEHLTKSGEPLNLKHFIRQLEVPVVIGGCASYHTALHLMRTGAVGVLVGVGSGEACTTRGVLGVGVPQATALADAAGARTRHLEETGVYAHVIADGGMTSGGDVAKAIACGADAVMIGAPLAHAAEAPGRGAHWDMTASHPRLPQGGRVATPPLGTLEEVLLGPASTGDGRVNLFGALRASMATCGYATIREFHKADVVVAPPAG